MLSEQWPHVFDLRENYKHAANKIRTLAEDLNGGLPKTFAPGKIMARGVMKHRMGPSDHGIINNRS